MPQPAARIGDMHVCPMVTPGVPPIPHVGGPILPPGIPNVLIGGLPAAVVGGMCVCVGPPDSIVKGSMGVFIGGMPAARMGDMTAHGGTIIIGCPTVLIGDIGGSGGSGGAAVDMKAFSDELHKKANEIMDQAGFSESDRNKVHKDICTVTGHPIDVATGKVFTDAIDFQLPGSIPLLWERTWFSTSTYKGNIGHGWHHSYGATLGINEKEKVAALRLPDGRVQIVPFLDDNTAFLLKKERISFFRKEHRFGYFDLNTRLTHWFSERPLGQEGSFPLVKIENNNAQNIQFDYAQNGALRQITDSAGRILTIETDVLKRITAIKTAKPDDATQLFSLVEYEYDGLGNLTKTRDPLKNGLSYRYQNHLMVQETDATGLSFYFKYDGTTEKAYCIQTWGDGGIYNHHLTYDLPNRCTTVLNSLGFDTKHYYNDMGLVIKTEQSDGSVLTKLYNRDAELVMETDELGRSTIYTHDGLGNLSSIIRPDGKALKSSFDLELLTGFEDAVDAKWAYKYNAERQMTERIDPLSRKTEFKYADENGLLEKIIDHTGQETTFEYDDFKNLSTVRMPDGTRSSWHYDSLGRCIEATDAKGNAQKIRYDLASNIIEVQEPDGNTRKLRYDAGGNLIYAKDQQHTVQFAYQGMGKLATRTEAGAQVSFHYDTEEQLVGIQNENGFAYRFELNKRGHVVKEIGFDGLTRQYRRDEAGQVTEILRGSSARSIFGGNAALISKYAYDTLGQVTEIQHSDKTTEQFSYRADGVLMLAQNNDSLVRFERDILGKVVKEYQNGVWVSSEYDDLDRRIKVNSSFGSKLAFGRNGMGDVNNVSANGRTEKWEAEFTRDDTGLETKRTMTGGVTSSWKRDNLGRPIEQQTLAGGVRKRHRQYSWDVNDRLKEIRDLVQGSNGTVKFGHDAVGNLAWAEHADGKFDFRMPDAVGNLFRTKSQSDRRYGPAGQLLEAEGTRFEYDREGNLIKKIEPNGKTWHYDWNASGMMSQVKRPDGEIVSFTYDALGRRLSKTYLAQSTRWIWDGNVPLHEWQERAHFLPPQYKPNYDDPIVQSRAQKAPDDLTTWVFEPGTFSPMAKITDAARYSIVNDHLGTPAAMFDDKGQEVWGLDLNIYGEIKNLRGEAMDCPFRYPGQYEDVETGLYYNRFRYYDPKVGNYVSQDPIGLRGGSKLYSYVPDPNKWADVFGLELYVIVGEGQAAVENYAKQMREQYPNDEFRTIKKDWKNIEKNSGANNAEFGSLEWEQKANKGNADWIVDRHNEGYKFIDIGEDSAPNRSSFYKTEKNTLSSLNATVIKGDNIDIKIAREGIPVSNRPPSKICS